MDRESLAWAAGVFDGEGHVGRTASRNRIYLDISQASTTGVPQMLTRIQNAVGFGHVRGPYQVPGRKPIYRYEIARVEHIQAFAAMLWPWLGDVKREDFRRVLSEWAAAHRPRGYNGEPRTHCAQGHSFAEHGFHNGRQRKCRICVKAWNDARPRKRAERSNS